MPPIVLPKTKSEEAERAVFDDIEAQFLLSDEKLHEIVTQFLEDFRLGLSEYNHPMAMMYVCYVHFTLIYLIYFEPNFRDWCAKWI